MENQETILSNLQLEHSALGRTLHNIASIKKHATTSALNQIIQTLESIPTKRLDLENDKYENVSVIDYAKAADNADFPYTPIDEVYLNEKEIVIAVLDDSTELPLFEYFLNHAKLLNNRVTLDTLYDLLEVMSDVLDNEL